MEIKTCKSMLNHWENPTHNPLFQENIKGHSGSLTNVPILKEINPKGAYLCKKKKKKECWRLENIAVLNTEPDIHVNLDVCTIFYPTMAVFWC